VKRFLAVLALLATLATPSAAAAGPDLRLMPLPGQVRAGQTVDLQWSEAPREVEELEIVLSLDDGRSWRVRVSPELESGTVHYRWRVPDLPAERARLRIRAGDDRGHEWEGAPGEAFEIVGSGGALAADPPLVERGWWFGAEASRAAEPRGLRGDATPTIEAGTGAWAGVPVPGATVLAMPPRGTARALPPPLALEMCGAANLPRPSRPIVVPLRN